MNFFLRNSVVLFENFIDTEREIWYICFCRIQQNDIRDIDKDEIRISSRNTKYRHGR